MTKRLTPLDLTKNELQNAVIQNLAGAPGSPVKGQIYFDSTANVMYWYSGTVWVAAQGGAAVSYGSPAASAVGDASADGVATTVTRSDHKHAREAFGAVTAQTSFGAASSNGAAATVTRSDHTHGTPLHDAAAHSAILGNVTAQTAFGGASANGSAGTVSRSDHLHGTPTHVDADHSAIHLNALAAPTASVAMGGQLLTGLGTPVSGTDAATKAYVDGLSQGLDVKTSVRALSTTLVGGTASGPQTVDGVSVIAGERVLINNGSLATNGIYVVAAGTWARAADMDVWAEVPGAFTFVEEGTVYADTGWVSTANASGTLGTTGITWTQFSGAGAITAGAGLTQSGTTLNIGAGLGITVNADDIAATFAGTGAANTVARSDHTHSAASTSVSANCAAATSTVVNHNLGTRDVIVNVYRTTTPWDTVECDVERTDTNNVTVRFSVAPAAGDYRIVVQA